MHGDNMNTPLINKLKSECIVREQRGTTAFNSYMVDRFDTEKFAELIVRECCLALWTEECHSSDLAFDEVKRNATRIKEHFGIDPKEITEAMLARSITWMEQQLANKNISELKNEETRQCKILKS
jgi:hypothetical protein